MDDTDMPPSRPTTIAIGAITAAAGGYVVLVSLGMVPPSAMGIVHAPLWIMFCAGFAFLLGGVAVVADAAAPRWLPVIRYFIVLAITACLATIGTWIAIGPGVRSFTIGGPFFDVRGGATLGRVAFGIGALILWLAFIALAIDGARKLLGRGKAGRSTG